MKVKIIEDSNPESLESAINIFISDKKVIDIKYSSVGFNTSSDDDIWCNSALIMYEDKE